MSPQTARRPLIAVASLLLAACGPAAKKVTPPGHCGPAASASVPVGETGPFHVGYRKFALTYAAPGVDAPRTINVNVWYPTSAVGQAGTSYLGIFPDGDSQENAAPAAPINECGYPLLAYSHGSQGLGGGAAYLMRHFASHGWVGVAPDHTENFFGSSLDPQPTSMMYLRSVDISHIVDAMAKFPPSDPLSRTATDRALIVGHSFGGMAVWGLGGVPYDVANIRANCYPGGTVPSGVCTDGELAEFAKGVGDARFVAGIAMADTWKGDWFGPTGYNAIQIPILAMSGSENDVHTANVYNGIAGKDYRWIELAGGCHETFNLGYCETLDAQVGYSVVETYALAYARKKVLGDTDATVNGIVEGTIPVSQIVTFKKK